MAAAPTARVGGVRAAAARAGPELLADLCEFCNSDALPPLAQAAIAHAQFETIHPFGDGNGRTGRAVIYVILRRRGLAPVVVPPISLVLATWAEDYVAGLMATRYHGAPGSAEAVEAVNRWVELFATATRRAVADAEAYERRVSEIQASWRARLGRVRANSAVDRLVGALPGAPVVTVQRAAALIHRSEQAVNEAIPRLLDAADYDRPSQPRVRGERVDRCFRRPRAPTREPGW